MVDCSVNIFDNTGTVSGDSSLNLLSKDEFVELIVPKVQEILNKRFQQMKKIFGTKVAINSKNEKSGKIEIEYYNQEELDRIMDLFRTIQ